MAEDLGSLKTDPLFLGLTRPSLVLGVTFPYFAFEGLFAIIIFIMTSNFKIFIVAAVMHVFGVMLCKKEPLAIDMLLVRLQKTPSVPNKGFHGGLNSYNMFD